MKGLWQSLSLLPRLFDYKWLLFLPSHPVLHKLSSFHVETDCSMRFYCSQFHEHPYISLGASETDSTAQFLLSLPDIYGNVNPGSELFLVGACLLVNCDFDLG